MAHLTNFSFEFFNKIFTEDASLALLYHGAKKSKMTENSNQGGPALSPFRLETDKIVIRVNRHTIAATSAITVTA